MHGGRLGQVIVEEDAHAIAAIGFDGRPRADAVVAPDVDHTARHQLTLHRLGDQMKHFHPAIHGVGQLGNIRRENADWRAADRLPVGLALRGGPRTTIILRLSGNEMWKRQRTSAKGQRTTQEGTPAVHNQLTIRSTRNFLNGDSTLKLASADPSSPESGLDHQRWKRGRSGSSCILAKVAV